MTVLFNADSHAEAARIASVSASVTTDVQARLVRVGATADVAVASGGPWPVTVSAIRAPAAPSA